MNSIRISRIICTVLLATLVFSGCATQASIKKKQEAKELFEKKIKQYNSLLDDLKSRKIKMGIHEDQVKALYGEPSDVFGSSSEASLFQMWIYEYPDASKSEAYSPVKLYFNNGKLSYWSS